MIDLHLPDEHDWCTQGIGHGPRPSRGHKTFRAGLASGTTVSNLC